MKLEVAPSCLKLEGGEEDGGEAPSFKEEDEVGWCSSPASIFGVLLRYSGEVGASIVGEEREHLHGLSLRERGVGESEDERVSREGGVLVSKGVRMTRGAGEVRWQTSGCEDDTCPVR